MSENKKINYNLINDLINDVELQKKRDAIKQWGEVPKVRNKTNQLKSVVFDSAGIAMDNIGITQYDINQIPLPSLSSRIGFPALAILSQHGILQNMAKAYSGDCTRRWIKINTKNSDDQSHVDKIKLIESEMHRFNIKGLFGRIVELIVTQGGCKLYTKIKNDDNELTTPLQIQKEKIGKGDVLYFKVVEPIDCTPINFNTTSPLLENYYIPQDWNVQSVQVDKSRLLHFAYSEPPRLLKPIYWFYGVSLTQLVIEYLNTFESVRKEIAKIMKRFNVNIIKTNMSALDDGADAVAINNLKSRIQLIADGAENMDVIALDNNIISPEEWQQFTMSLGGLPDILAQNAELISAVSQVPVVKLFGTQPKGFNASGDIELRMWYDRIHSLQESLLRPNLENVFKLIQLNLFGEIDDGLIFEFVPLYQPTEKEQAEIDSMQANIDVNYVNSGIIAPEEIRTNLINAKNGKYTTLEDIMPDDIDNDID